MPSPTVRGGAGGIDAIERLCAAQLPAQELIERIVERVQRVVPSDSVFFTTADPQTNLCMGSGVVHNLPEETCQPLWEHEFLVPDYNKFTDLAAGPRTVADLHEATGGRPQRSARWREFHTLLGIDSEVRAAFTAGGSAWGFAQLHRTGDVTRYSPREIAWLEQAAPIIARGLRAAMVSQPAAPRAARGPGIVILDEQARVVSLTAEAESWLAEVETALQLRSPAGPVPIEMAIYAAAARATAHPAPELKRARLRTKTGMWLLMHVSDLRDGDGASTHTAIVVEPAKASDVAPLIVEAYQLTQREVEVTRMVARGLRTAEVAEKLFLSPHTVRDHLKAVFEKVGVSSRGELVAKMFAEHYHDDLADAIEHEA